MKNIIDSATDLMLFTYLVEHKSFTSLANTLNINKSIISKRIKNLENQLGTQLLIRSTRNLGLTAAGQLLYNRCEVLQKDLQEVHAELSDLSQTPTGTLRLGASNNFAQEHLTPLIAEFLEIYPTVKFRLLIGRSYQCIIKNSIDLGFHVGNLPSSNLVARRLTTRRMIVCATPQYFTKHSIPTIPEDLKNHNCLGFMENTPTIQWMFHQRGMPSKSITVKGNLKATSVQVLKSAALNHMGIAMLPGHILTRELKSGQLVPTLQDYETDHLDIYAIYAQTQHLPRRARLFLDFVIEKFNSVDYWKYR